MSDLSEEIEAAYKGLNEKHVDIEDGQAEVHYVREDSEVAQLPAYHAVQQYYAVEMVKAVRRAYRYNSGREPFPSGPVAYEQTRGLAHKHMMTTAIEAFADGVQMGHEISAKVRKFMHFDKADDLITDPDFRTESSMIALNVMSDPDCMEFFDAYFFETTEWFMYATGFANVETKENTQKVWDLWALSAMSMITAFYGTGCKLGASWKERDVLSGIESATEAQVEET